MQATRGGPLAPSIALVILLGASGCTWDVSFLIENDTNVPVTLELSGRPLVTGWETSYGPSVARPGLPGEPIVLQPGERVSHREHISPPMRRTIPIGQLTAAGPDGAIVMSGDLALLPARDEGCTVFVRQSSSEAVECHHVTAESRQLLKGYTWSSRWQKAQLPLALAATLLVAAFGTSFGGSPERRPPSAKAFLLVVLGCVLAFVAVVAGLFTLAMLDAREQGSIIAPYSAAVIANVFALLAFVPPWRYWVRPGLILAALAGATYAGIAATGISLESGSLAEALLLLPFVLFLLTVPFAFTFASGLVTGAR